KIVLEEAPRLTTLVPDLDPALRPRAPGHGAREERSLPDLRRAGRSPPDLGRRRGHHLGRLRDDDGHRPPEPGVRRWHRRHAHGRATDLRGRRGGSARVTPALRAPFHPWPLHHPGASGPRRDPWRLRRLTSRRG